MSDDLLRDILREANKGDMFRKVLAQARDTKSLVQIYANAQNLEQSHIGFVRSLGGETLLLQELTWEGETDGTTAFGMREVLEIATNTRKLRRTQLLFEQGLHDLSEEEEIIEEECDNCVEEELKRAQSAEELVSLRVATEHDYTQVGGFVRYVGDGYVQVEMITTAGEPDGLATLRIKEVACVMRNDRQHRAAMQFYKYREQLYGQEPSEDQP